MNFSFSRVATEVTSQQIKQVKKWIYQYFEIDDDISISRPSVTVQGRRLSAN